MFIYYPFTSWAHTGGVPAVRLKYNYVYNRNIILIIIQSQLKHISLVVKYSIVY
jgi:hypothetical protein